MIRRLTMGLGLAAALVLGSCGEAPSKNDPARPKELAFSILSAENQASMGPLWQPLLDDLSKQTGLKVKPYFTSNYASQIEAMRFGQVQVGWFSAVPALEAVRRSNAEVLGRIVDSGGSDAYTSVIIVKKGSGITLESLLKCDRKYTFGMGDSKSTSGTLAPKAYLFTPRGIEPANCFKTVRSANHQSNAFSVANGVLDVATNNSVGLLFAARDNPKVANEIEVIWRSPPLPESAILARKDLDPAIREKLRQFFLTYGTGTGPDADRQRQVLKGLSYGGFKAADDSYLDPIREMEAAEALADAKKAGDAAKTAAAQKAFDEISAKNAAKRAANPDI
jgi:phosphonate transport system substrate-binding protein